MEDNIKPDITGTEAEIKDPSTDSKSKRSASYPSISLSEAYDFALKINEQFSSTAEVTRDEIAHAVKLNAGTIIRDISSCVQYHLLDKNTAAGKYKLGKIFKDIYKPDSERDKKLSFIEAFGSPKLYQELITRYDNATIPNELENVLVKYHGITEAAAKGAADIFIESGKYVGVINENKFLKYAITKSTVSKIQLAEIEDMGPGDGNSTNNGIPNFAAPAIQVQEDDKKNINIPIYLTNNKKAVFAYPEDISENDIKIVKHQLEGIILRITLENEERKQNSN
jgi:hypothetical protein